MVRKTDPDKRKAFMDASLTLFVRNGIQGTSTAAIAREAGTAAGTLFLYFPRKQDLIDALVLEISRKQADNVTRSLKDGMNAFEMFSTIWDGVISWFRSHPEAYSYVQLVRDTGLISPEVVDQTGQIFSFYFRAIGKGLSEKTIQDLPPELVGEILYRDIVAVMNLIIRNPDSEKQTEYIRRGFDIFWRGIGVEI